LAEFSKLILWHFKQHKFPLHWTSTTFWQKFGRFGVGGYLALSKSFKFESTICMFKLHSSFFSIEICKTIYIHAFIHSFTHSLFDEAATREEEVSIEFPWN
jgi:hypothetical protein